MTLVEPPTTSRNFAAKAWWRRSPNPIATASLRQLFAPSAPWSFFGRKSFARFWLAPVNQKWAANPRTGVSSTNTTRPSAKTCLRSWRISASLPRNRQNFVDVLLQGPRGDAPHRQANSVSHSGQGDLILVKSRDALKGLGPPLEFDIVVVRQTGPSGKRAKAL